MTQAVVLTMVSNKEEGLKIAHHLVENKLAACVNVVDKATSVYRWEGKVCEETEYLLIIKTEAANFEEVKDRILKLHSYKMPEIILFNIDKGEAGYLDWISANS